MKIIEGKFTIHVSATLHTTHKSVTGWSRYPTPMTVSRDKENSISLSEQRITNIEDSDIRYK